MHTRYQKWGILSFESFFFFPLLLCFVSAVWLLVPIATPWLKIVRKKITHREAEENIATEWIYRHRNWYSTKAESVNASMSLSFSPKNVQHSHEICMQSRPLTSIKTANAMCRQYTSEDQVQGCHHLSCGLRSSLLLYMKARVGHFIEIQFYTTLRRYYHSYPRTQIG